MKVTTDSCLFGAWINSEKKAAISVLDIGAGTGLLSLLFAQNHSSASIDAIELDGDAFGQAFDNFSQSPWAHRLKAIHADVKTFPFNKKYNVIISNPPFYEKEIKGGDRLKNIAHHNEGLLFQELMVVIKDKLEPCGEFFLLLPFKRNEEIKRFFLSHSLHIDQMVFVRQTVNHAFFRMMIKGKLSRQADAETELSEISIKEKNGNYTSEFSELLGPFYLNL